MSTSKPGSYEIYKRTNEFPEGTILFKELQLTLPGQKPRRFADRAIGQGLFPRSSQRRRCDGQRFQALCRFWRGGAFYNFNHHEPKSGQPPK